MLPRDIPRFLALCRACPHYGRRWGCPPFDADPLEGAKSIELQVRRVEVRGDVEQAYEAARKEFDAELLALETPGKRAFLAGRCLRCPTCLREKDLPCPHARPSLEAAGVDLSRCAELDWSGKNLTLIGAIVSF